MLTKDIPLNHMGLSHFANVADSGRNGIVVVNVTIFGQKADETLHWNKWVSLWGFWHETENVVIVASYTS